MQKSRQPFKCLKRDSHHISESTTEWQFFPASCCAIFSSVALCDIFVDGGLYEDGKHLGESVAFLRGLHFRL